MRVAPTPKLAVETADVIISTVTDSDASRAVWLNPETGAIWGLPQDPVTSNGAKPIAIESSTVTVSWVKELAAEITNRSVAFLDAPVVGSRPQAESGNLIYLIGGQAEILTQAENVLLSAGGAKIHHVGDIGQGMAMKLAVNAFFGIQVASLAEILGILTNNGLGLEKAIQCFGELPVMSAAAKNAANLMLAHNHAPMFPIDLVEKDFRYVLEVGREVDAPTPASTAIHEIYLDAIAAGYDSDNITSVARLFL